MVLLTIVLGGTILLVFFITSLLKQTSKQSSEEHAVDESSTNNDNKSSSDQKPQSQKSKKKLLDKKGKEKVFQHPWLVSTLKGHGGRVLGEDEYIFNCWKKERSISLLFKTWILVPMVNTWPRVLTTEQFLSGTLKISPPNNPKDAMLSMITESSSSGHLTPRHS